MARLGATMQNLSQLRKRWQDTLSSARPGDHSAFRIPDAQGRLTPVAEFGPNPGALQMFVYVPTTVRPKPALVVVLHGCRQTASGYDDGSGWSRIADRHGFVLVFPQQNPANNPYSCFNWFQPADTARGKGEAASIRQMVEHASSAHGVDRARIFVTGLSAGGAMAAAMLAAYPEVFAAGGIIAGLPYGTASNAQAALGAMAEPTGREPRDWAERVRQASSFRGPWPRVSIWHGDADAVVKPGNAVELVKQWTELHGIHGAASLQETVDGHIREIWRSGDGREVVESFMITGMGHGTPLDVGRTDGTGGVARPYMLDVGISSSNRIAAFWGLTESVAPHVEQHRPDSAPQPILQNAKREAIDGEILPPGDNDPSDGNGPGPSDYVQAVIRDALRAAGLMKR